MAKLPSNIVGIDLGNHAVKAVRLQKKGAGYSLVGAAYAPTGRDPTSTVLPMEDAVAALLKQVSSQVKAGGAEVHFTINTTNSTVRYVELPQIPVEEMRSALKLNSATYLRQNFENYTFDACALDPAVAAALAAAKAGKAPKGGAHGKVKVLVGGVANGEVMLYFHSSRRAGMKPRSLQLVPISLINGFEVAFPDVFQNQAVAVLDVGFLSSSLTILEKGMPLLTRTVPMGGKQITEYIAQTTGGAYAKAEADKLKGEADVGEALARTAVTLIREVRSSINFFEKNSDQPLSKIYLSGGTAASTMAVEALASDIGSPCEVWNAAQGLAMELPADQQDVFTRNLSAFAAALGAARSSTVEPSSAAPVAAPAATAPTTPPAKPA